MPSSSVLCAAVLRSAAGLALAAAVSLGLARFSYALLLPAMRGDLGWTYFTAGAMNTVNAAGYLLGALLAPRALARFDARQLMLAGGVLAAVMLAAHGAVRSDAAMYALRLGTGVGSAMSFIAGGLLAARLAAPALRSAASAAAAASSTAFSAPSAVMAAPPVGNADAQALALARIHAISAGGSR